MSDSNKTGSPYVETEVGLRRVYAQYKLIEQNNLLMMNNYLTEKEE